MQHHMSESSEVGGITEPSSIIPSIEAGLPSPLVKPSCDPAPGDLVGPG